MIFFCSATTVTGHGMLGGVDCTKCRSDEEKVQYSTLPNVLPHPFPNSTRPCVILEDLKSTTSLRIPRVVALQPSVKSRRIHGRVEFGGA